MEYMIKASRGFISGSKGVPLGERRAAFISMRNNLTDDIFIDSDKAFAFFRRRNIKVGISCTFKNIGNTFLHVAEAERAIVIGSQVKPDDIVYDYERFSVLAAIDDCLDSDGRRGLVNPKLGMIRDYDRIHGTDYYETLKCYMESDLNKNLTAQKMNIHRNTVEYRINRLIEAYGIDPNDGELAMSYRLSFFLFSSI